VHIYCVIKTCFYLFVFLLSGCITVVALEKLSLLTLNYIGFREFGYIIFICNQDPLLTDIRLLQGTHVLFTIKVQ